MNRHASSLWFVALGCLVCQVSAQQPAPPRWILGELPALRVDVTQVVDVRPSMAIPGRTTLTFSIITDGLPADTTPYAIRISKAEDNLGHAVPTIAVDTIPVSPSPASPRVLIGRGALASIERDADSLRFVEGVIEFEWWPLVESMLVKVDNIATRSGPVEASGLVWFGINVRTYSNQADYEQLCTELGLPSLPLPKFPQTLGFYIRDPALRYKSLELLDNTGQTIPASVHSSGTFKEGAFVNLEFTQALPAGARLVLWLKPDPIVKTVPFRVEDIKLP